ncbi:hypothetical protein EMIT0P74_10315 [Pseudomonas sp. IT-P74]
MGVHAVCSARQPVELADESSGRCFQQAEAKITFLTGWGIAYWREVGFSLEATVSPPQLI